MPGPGTAPDAPTAAPPDPLHGLTDGERRVVDLVGRGSTNREIADRLHLSVRTVEGHLQSVYRKLGVRTRTALAVLTAAALRPTAPPGPPALCGAPGG